MHREAMREPAAALGLELAANGVVFVGDEFEQPWRPDVTTNRFVRLRTRIGADGVRLHDLGTSWPPPSAGGGTPIATISGRLGHRDVATTLNVYSHFLPADDRQAARTLGDLLG